jgi:hypothetical protein
MRNDPEQPSTPQNPQNPPALTTPPVITNFEDPKFDLEAFLQAKAAESQ